MENKKVASTIIDTIDKYQKGDINIEVLQDSLENLIFLLEGVDRKLMDRLKNHLNELEKVRFTKLIIEQRPSAVKITDDLKEELKKVFLESKFP